MSAGQAGKTPEAIVHFEQALSASEIYLNWYTDPKHPWQAIMPDEFDSEVNSFMAFQKDWKLKISNLKQTLEASAGKD